MRDHVISNSLKYGVLVIVNGEDNLGLKIIGRPFHKNEFGSISISGSGILINPNQGIVYTTATILSPFLKRSSTKDKLKLIKRTKIRVLLDDDSSSEENFLSAKFLKIKRSDKIRNILKRFKNDKDWIVGWERKTDHIGHYDSSKINNVVNRNWKGFEDIAVLQIESSSSYNFDYIRPPISSMKHIKRGQKLLLIGSPFGLLSPSIFHNCTYLTTASNLIYDTIESSEDSPKMIMLDQSCLPGCEGGPVFDENGNLIGMLTPPLRRTDGSNIDVFFVLPIQYFIESDLLSDNIILSNKNLNYNDDSSYIISKALKSIVLVSIGSFWGSGVLISDKGHVLTSGHTFQQFVYKDTKPFNPKLYPGYHTEVRIDQNTEQGKSNLLWYKASIIYLSNSHLDVALLKIENPPSGLVPIEPRKSYSNDLAQPYDDPKKGENIHVLGYGLFGPSKKIRATCTSGIISGVTHLHGRPHLIQTNASVNKGASGGAVIDSKGKFLGLVTCNAMTNDGTVIPKINFSIPMTLLSPAWEYIRYNDISYLNPLGIHDEECESLWNFMSNKKKNKVEERERQFAEILNRLERSAVNTFEKIKSKL